MSAAPRPWDNKPAPDRTPQGPRPWANKSAVSKTGIKDKPVLEAAAPKLNGAAPHDPRPTINEADIRKHVEAVHRLARGCDGILMVCAFGENPHQIDPKTGKMGKKLPAINRRFAIGGVDVMVAEVLRLANVDHTNVYMPLAVMRRSVGPNQKGGEQDVVRVLGLVADMDTDTGKVGNMPIEPSYELETSAGNHQPFFWFNSPLKPRNAKRLAVALQKITGCDHGTADISHVWRIAGTLNWPSAVKLGRGRSPEPQMVKVATPWNGARIKIKDLYRALVIDAEPAESEEPDAGTGSNLSTEQMLALNGANRSKQFFKAVCSAIRNGMTIDSFEALARKHPNGCAFKYLNPDRLRVETERIWKKVEEEAAGGIRLEHFRSYLVQHNYFYLPTRESWPGGSVNARLPRMPVFDADGNPVLNDKLEQVDEPATAWLDRNAAVVQITWAPGEPQLIENRVVDAGGWMPHRNVTVLNLYRPPSVILGDANQAGMWIDHVRKVYADDTDHIIRWLAQRVQRPQDKINHALVLGGAQGIGKDTLLEPVKRAVGPWNCNEVSPTQIVGRFNGFVKSVILRVSEARDLGDVNRYAFYEHMKTYTAAPPDVLRVDEKHLREHAVINCCGVVITTNYKSDGIYLPADDRRHFVAWSELSKDDFTEDYWRTLWDWYERGGYGHVAAYLASMDLSGFNPKAPPPKTAAFWSIVDANRAPEDAELADVLDELGSPYAVTLDAVTAAASGDFADWMRDRKNRRVLPHRFEQCGYVRVRSGTASDGRWVVSGRRQVIYAKMELSLHEQLKAAARLAD
jgi:hypothetical protein